MKRRALSPKMIVQQIKVYLESPVTDLDLLIFNTMSANPKVCTVPASVNISENYPSLKTKQRIKMIIARITQYRPSYFLNIFIIRNYYKTTLCTLQFSQKKYRLAKFQLIFRIIIMKQEFQKSRQELIIHIEASLAMLKQQRDSLLNQSSQNSQSEKIKISTYLQNQKKNASREKPKVIKPNLDRKIIDEQIQIIPSKKEIIGNRLNAKQKCQVLKELYERKRQMQSAGIYENNPQQIKKFYENQKNVDKLKKDLIKNKKKEQQKQAKQKIIEEQLNKVQSFLKQSKKIMKNRTAESNSIYSQLLKDKKQQLSQFQTLLNKHKLSIVEKGKLLQITFAVLQQYPERVNKKVLQEFLLANDKFCKIFYLTNQEIMRDLLVHKTQEQNYLKYQQFYEYIKSVQITNKAIKPNLNYQTKDIKNINKKQSVEENKQKQQDKSAEQYLKKLFLYLDQRKQKIIQRQRIEIALCKGLLFDEKTMKKLSKETIIKFGQYIKKKRISIGDKSYYKNLDLKYIGMQQLFQLYKNFINQPSKKRQEFQVNNSQGYNESKANQLQFYDEDIEFIQPKLVQIIQNKPQPQKETKLQQDFQKFGWGDNTNNKQHFAQLKQLDVYYKQMKDKYGNEIHWNNYKVYQEDFKKFNQAISQMKGKHQNSKDFIGLTIQHPVHQEQAQQYSDND